MKRDTTLFIKDILDNIYLIKESTEKISKEDFLNDQLIQDATVRRIEIIGEAAKNIPKDIKEKYPNIEWKKATGTRDIFIHAYFEVDLDIVWNIIKKDLLDLEKEMIIVLKDLESSSNKDNSNK
tara:strand:- start:1110 stop:1481 length:372 start_codon:yes stop_codon:yes gene_type:complete